MMYVRACAWAPSTLHSVSDAVDAHHGSHSLGIQLGLDKPLHHWRVQFSPLRFRCGAGKRDARRASATTPERRRQCDEVARAQDARVYSHDGPIGRRTHRYILTMDQSDAGRTGIFSRWTNRTQARAFPTTPLQHVASHAPITCQPLVQCAILSRRSLGAML
eukprot:5419605-Pyramimonas_sp.AAC.1